MERALIDAQLSIHDEEAKEPYDPFIEPLIEPSSLASSATVSNEQLQEKQDEIEILQEQLAKERENMRALEKRVADINEEYQIL